MLRLALIGIATAMLALLLLDIAAFMTGNQPNFYAEYAMLGISVPLLAALVRILSRLRQRRDTA